MMRFAPPQSHVRTKASGLKYWIAGILLIMLGMLLVSFSFMLGGTSGSGAFIFFIGPIPFAFAYGGAGLLFLIICIVFVIFFLLITYLMIRELIRVQ